MFKKYNQRISDMQRNRTPGTKQRGEKKSKFEYAKFLAWDGEGMQQEDKQVYALLANSDGDYLFDEHGLSTLACFNFLTSDKYTNNTLHVCFGASYDVNMMLRDIDHDLLVEIHKGAKPVLWKNYLIEYRPRKSFSISRIQTEKRNKYEYLCYDEKKHRYKIKKSVTLWDVFGFFQSKFVNCLKDWTKNTVYEKKYKSVIKDIEQGKQKRGSFTRNEMEKFVLPYCLNECYALKDIMLILHGYLKEANLVLARWDGAGAIAASGMKRENIKQHIRIGEKLDQEPYSEDIVYAAECAYFGGWIEAYLFGHIELPVYHYDVCSAYPSMTRDLVSLTTGHWEKFECGRSLPLSKIIEKVKQFPSFWLAHVEWNNGPIYGPGAFCWRNKQGSVSKPIRGKGWQWNEEILAAYDCFPKLELSIDQIYYYVPDEIIKPFAFVDEIYDLRKKLKAEGKGMEKVLKLFLNSLYGKLAQSQGYNEERDIKPPYHCILYAGLITSNTRAKILRAVMQNPSAIISIATDGIYSLAPLDLDIGNGLGQWEFTLHESMTICQPGFYWYSTNGEEKHYYRGFNEGSITRQQVIEALKAKKSSIDVPTTRFITLGAAMGLRDFSVWRTWRTKNRSLDISMSKSGKRIFRGDYFPGYPLIKITRNKVFPPELFIDHPELLESKKYEYAWDETRSMGFFDGQSVRTIIEEMFHMEETGE